MESSYTPGMSCGKGIPVYKIRIEYGAEKPLVLMLEKEKNVQKMLDTIGPPNLVPGTICHMIS